MLGLKLGMLLFVVAGLSKVSGAVTDWSQPSVLCVEEVVPSLPEKACLDLSSVVNPSVEWPAGLTSSEREHWEKDARGMTYCRAVEVKRRESLHAGSFSPGLVEMSWMQEIAPQHFAKKVAAVYEASRVNHLPAQVLTGALYQESIFAELGVAEDGGNFSCGVGQVNVQEWCRWANEQSADDKNQMQWPTESVNCGDVRPAYLAPFYKIARSRLHGAPEYHLGPQHFSNIPFASVVAGFPEASTATQTIRFRALTSFALNCSDSRFGILAKGHELALLYKDFVPAGLKQKDLYAPGDHFARQCEQSGSAAQYPLNVGWLVAVGAYNAGPRVVDALAYYNRFSESDLARRSSFSDFEPQDLIESFYGAGQYDSNTSELDFETVSGKSARWSWMTACVLQRHIAKVVQHVTRPGVSLAKSMEQPYGCRPSVMDTNGNLIESFVPPARQSSSGFHN